MKHCIKVVQMKDPFQQNSGLYWGTMTVTKEVPKTVICSIPKTALVVNVAYTMRCTMTPILPCATCDTATLGYSRTSNYTWHHPKKFPSCFNHPNGNKKNVSTP